MKHQFTNHVYGKLRCLFFISALLLCVTTAFASHFRYGNITWQRVPGNSKQIKFKVTQAWRKSFYTGVHPNFQIGSVVSTSIFNFGDGNSTTIDMKITAMNLTEDWIYGEWTYTKTYATTGTYDVSYTNCCKIAQLVNNASTQALVTAVVQVGAGNDAPVVSIPPYINFPKDKSLVSYQIPAVDPNGDNLTFSLAPNGSFGAATVVQPAGFAVSPTGLATWNTIGKTIGQQYNSHILVTDSKGARVNVDFIIRIVDASTPSDFDYTVSPPSGTTFESQPGDPIGFQIKAGDVDPGDTTTLSGAGLPTGSTFTTSGTNPVTGTFNWTPADSQQGSYVINITAQDKAGVQNNTSINLNVSYKPRFDIPTMPGNNSYFVVKPGDSISHPVKAYHPDTLDGVELTLSGGKPAMNFTPAFPLAVSNPVSTSFKWKPSASDWGLNRVAYKAQDTFHKAVAYDTIYYIVDNPPVITSTPDTIAKAGLPFTYVLKATDLDSIFGDKLKVEEITLPSFLTLAQNSYGQWTITGTPGMNDVGNYYINIEVADSMNHIGGTHLSNAVQAFMLHVMEPAGGLRFDGVNDYARVANPYASFAKEITVDFYADIDPASKIGSGISQSTENVDGAPHMMWMMHYSPGSNVMQFYISDNGTWKHADATVLPGVHRYTGVAGPTGIKIYVDGVLAATSPNVVNTGILNVANSVMHFGKDSRYATGRFMKGQIDEVRIWNRALCASEVAHYNSCELPEQQNGLVEYYKFNQGYAGANNTAINTVTDASGNNKTATLNNFALTGNTSNWVSGSINNVCSAYVPPVASITAGGSTTVCYGESVVLTANAGASYQWTKDGVNINGATSQSYTATQSGAYAVTVFTASGCSGLSPVANITVAPQLTVAGNAVNALIFGTNTGSVNITAAGGTAPYTYAWSNSSTSEDLSGVGMGTYSVVVSDAIGCTAAMSFTVSQPAQLLATASVNNALIYNTNTGSIDLNVTGGVGPYTYSWSNNASAEDINALGAGTYTVTVTDANGAIFTATYTVTQPAQLTVSGIVINATIYNVTNGAINITPAGGVGPYTYSWSNNVTTEDVNGLGAGPYTVTVTDANGAIASATYQVTQPAQLVVTGVVSHATIYGASNGAINITAAGGVGPYTYLWNGNVTTEDRTNISAGTYTVTVTDANGATKTGVFTITQPPQLNGTISVNPVYSVNNNHTPYTLYKGYRDYTYLTAIPTGGVPGYTYSWSPATGCSNPTSATTKVTPAVTTTYTVTITDSKGATKTVSQTINVIDVRCYAGNSPLHKIYVCHNGKNTICIDTNALATHLNQHGDLVGRCEDYQNKNSYDGEDGHEDHQDGLSAIGEIEKNMILFPNPSDGRFTVKLPALPQEGQLVVRDIMGRVVSMSTVASSDVEQILQVDLSAVAKGTYIIMVSSGKELYRSSMLVQ